MCTANFTDGTSNTIVMRRSRLPEDPLDQAGGYHRRARVPLELGQPGGIAAAVSPDRKIPWTKPEDITVGTEFPLKLGEAGGIAAPHSFGKGPTGYRAAPVLFANGRSRALLDTIDPSTLSGLLTPSGGEVLSSNKAPA